MTTIISSNQDEQIKELIASILDNLAAIKSEGLSSDLTTEQRGRIIAALKLAADEVLRHRWRVLLKELIASILDNLAAIKGEGLSSDLTTEQRGRIIAALKLAADEVAFAADNTDADTEE
jgi:hypothetical protein